MHVFQFLVGLVCTLLTGFSLVFAVLCVIELVKTFKPNSYMKSDRFLYAVYVVALLLNAAVCVFALWAAINYKHFRVNLYEGVQQRQEIRSLPLSQDKK